MKIQFNLINRYIIRIIFPNFFLGIGIFSIIHLIQYLYELVSLAIERDIPIFKVLKLLVYIIPFLMTFTIPVGVLIGILLAMGELSANGEIIAMRANGIRILDIFKPCLLFGIFIALFHIFFFQTILPWGNTRYVAEKIELLKRNPTLEIATKKHFSENEIAINIEQADTKKQIFYGVRVVNFKENLLLMAKEGVFLPKDEAKNSYPLILKDVIGLPYIFKSADKKLTQHFYREMTVYIKDFDYQKVIPKGAQLEGILELMDRINNMKNINIIAEIRNEHSMVKRSVQIMQKKEEIYQLEPGSAEAQNQVHYLNMLIANQKNQGQQTELLREDITPKHEVYLLHQKFSYATSAILMAFLALPLGMVHRRRGKEVALGIGIIVVITYQSLLTAGNFGWKLGFFSPYAGAWFPNIIIGFIIGIIGYFKLRKI